MEKRWKDHVSTALKSKGGRWHFPNAVRKYGSDAFSHEVLQENIQTLEEANSAEKFWIEKYDTRDPKKGFNLAEGGAHTPHAVDRSYWQDPEFRARMSAAAKARWQDPTYRAMNLAATKAALNTHESKEKRSIISKEIRKRPEVRAKLDNMNVGRIFSLEHRAKIAARMKGNNPSVETREKLSIASRSMSPEIRARITALNTGKKRSPETRARVSAAFKGKKPSLETFAAIQHKHEDFVLNPTCRHHGKLGPNEYYTGKHKTGKTRIICKACRKIRNAMRYT